MDGNKQQFNPQEFHRALKEAGFTRQRAAFQTSLGRLTEKVVHKLGDGASYEWMMTGSYVEGWGNNLFCLDGVTGFNSDIDWSQVVKHKVYHLGATCHSVVDCVNRKDHVLEDGHISVKHCSKQPAFDTKRCGLRPDADECHAYPCCSYPEVRSGDGETDAFRRDIIEVEFDNDNPKDDVHFVRASVPGKQNQMRLSCTKQERTIMSKLTTPQGQLFVLLKYLIKGSSQLPGLRRNGHKDSEIIAKGLKSFHAKTLLMTLLRRRYGETFDQTPATKDEREKQEADHLMEMLLEALQILRQHLAATDGDGIPPVMDHALLKDAGLYLKVPRGPGRGQRQADENADQHRQLMRSIRSDIDRLLASDRQLLYQLLTEYQGRLQKAQDSFLFVPLMLMPRINADAASLADEMRRRKSEVEPADCADRQGDAGIEESEDKESEESEDSEEWREFGASVEMLADAYRRVWRVLKALGTSQRTDGVDSELEDIASRKSLRTTANCLAAMREMLREGWSEDTVRDIVDSSLRACRRIPFSDRLEAQQLESFVRDEDCLWAFHFFLKPGENPDFSFVSEMLKKIDSSVTDDAIAKLQLHNPISVINDLSLQPSVTVNFDCLHCRLVHTFCDDKSRIVDFLQHAASCVCQP